MCHNEHHQQFLLKGAGEANILVESSNGRCAPSTTGCTINADGNARELNTGSYTT